MLKRVVGCPGIFWKMHERNGLNLGILMDPDHLQQWLKFGYGLFIFLILVPFFSRWKNEIYVFLRTPVINDCKKFSCWCKLTAFRTAQILVMVNTPDAILTRYNGTMLCFELLSWKWSEGITSNMGRWFRPEIWNIFWIKEGKSVCGYRGICMAFSVEFCLIKREII